MQEEIENFLDKCCEMDVSYVQCKYVVQRLLGSQQEFDPRGKATVAAANVQEICRAWNKEDEFLKWKNYRQRHGLKSKSALEEIDGIHYANFSFSPFVFKKTFFFV